MSDAERIDHNGPAVNRGRRGGQMKPAPVPNELLIQLTASGLRMAAAKLEPERAAPPVFLVTLSSDMSRMLLARG
jgi:hypothetical protein